MKPAKLYRWTVWLLLVLAAASVIKEPLVVNWIASNYLRTASQPPAAWSPPGQVFRYGEAALERISRFQMLGEMRRQTPLDSQLEYYQRQASALQPANPIASLLLAGYLYQQGQVAAGEALLLPLVAADCQVIYDASVFWQRPVYGIQIPVNDQTRASFDRLARSLMHRLEQCSTDTIIQVGRVSMLALSDTALAQAWFQRALQAYPTNDGILYHLFVLAQWDGRYEQALEFLLGLEELQGGTIWIDDYNLCLQRAQIYADLPGKGELAIRSYQDALRINPQDAYLYLRIAQVHESENRLSQALEAYRTALVLPDDPRVNRAAIQSKIQELEKSLNQ